MHVPILKLLTWDEEISFKCEHVTSHGLVSCSQYRHHHYIAFSFKKYLFFKKIIRVHMVKGKVCVFFGTLVMATCFLYFIYFKLLIVYDIVYLKCNVLDHDLEFELS